MNRENKKKSVYLFVTFVGLSLFKLQPWMAGGRNDDG